MVATDLALLSFAALSVFGFGTARGAQSFGPVFPQLSPRNDTIYDVLKPATDTVTSLPTLTSSPKPPSRGSPGKGAGGASPVTASIDLGNQANSPVTSTEIGFHATAGAALDGPESSTSSEYPYPGGFGAGGTLTTDTNAPTRSPDPTRGSVIPTSSSLIDPPPGDTIRPPARNGPPVIATAPGNVPDAVHSPTTLVASTSKSPPKRPTSKETTVSVRSSSISLDLGHGQPSITTPYANATGIGWNFTTSITPTWTTSTTQVMTTDENGSTLPVCGPAEVGKQRTIYSVIHTETITWYGNPDDYTPPFPEIATPTPCVQPKSPLRLTFSYCSSTGTGTKYVTCDTTTSMVYTTATATLEYGVGSLQPTVIFITTDKNPAVVYTTIHTPDYGISRPGTRAQIDHSAAVDPGAPITTPEMITQPNSQAIHDPGKTTAANPITIAVQPTGVVINSHTFTDNPSSRTQTVVVDGQTFIINPSQVIGGGAIVDRPTVTGGVFVPTPTSTNMGGLPVVVSSSVAVIDGTSFTMGPTPTTAIVRGQTISVGPNGVAVGTQTIPVSVRPSSTEVVVAGGDLITAVGQSVIVIHDTTITFGPGSSSVTVIGDDTITIGPSGVIVHGTTLGGPAAGMTDTQYEIVGGATITQVGASVIVINSVTYTVGPGADTKTTVVGGETITIGPSGVSVSTYSLSYPFGPTITITPGATGVLTTPKPTASKDSGSSLRPDWTWMSLLSCIAIGVMGSGI